MNIQITLDLAIEQLEGIDACASRIETASGALGSAITQPLEFIDE